MERFLKHHHLFRLDQYLDQFSTLVREKRYFLENTKGNFQRFRKVLDSIPDFKPSIVDTHQKFVTAGRSSDITPEENRFLKEKLELLCPWRKGPFKLFGVEIDTEWQSWMKWDRFKNHLPDLKGKMLQF